MSKLAFTPLPPYARLVPQASRKWVPSLGIWGAGAGTAVLFLLSVTPLVKREFLVKVPVLGSYYADKTPDSDKPF
ncbi:hypothetical protein SISSUDRAFT_1124153 [Sistotremastrum suecicum HHB10207 ss-3]|uniref:Uncharacterized protein n=1 Tax=Sistotremastrum suecicum HHB10207 ss-3 TaxID=1314776 RepID=A0A166IQQ1_9AGAM|nr:hypothetical protein SISSUDRAFT_1124153 [Sistotremastrum suecicum HHB10207 ss-3]